MNKLANIFMSAVLSVSVILGFEYHQSKVQDFEFNRLRTASWRVDILLDGSKVGSCSGTFIKPHLMLTAAHCHPSFSGITFKVDGKDAISVKEDVVSDLMLLYVYDKTTNFVDVKFDDVAKDTKVVVVGYPFGISQFLTEGRVQETAIPPVEVQFLEPMPDHFLAFSAPISPGNSGGGVFTKDATGKYVLVGVVSRGGGSVGLAVPPDLIMKFLK